MAAHSFHPASKPLRNAGLSDLDRVCKACMCVRSYALCRQLVCVHVCPLHFLCASDVHEPLILIARGIQSMCSFI